jgi:hypothetical protein
MIFCTESGAGQRDGVPSIGLGALAPAVVALVGCAQTAGIEQPQRPAAQPSALQDFDAQIQANARRMLDEGKQIFRFDTFGSGIFRPIADPTVAMSPRRFAPCSTRRSFTRAAPITTAALPRWQKWSSTTTCSSSWACRPSKRTI